MRVVGIGIDVADAERIGRLVRSSGSRFAQRWFTPDEAAQCAAAADPALGYAEVFAAKEAVWKCLGLAWAGPVPWRSIVILRPDRDGPLRVRLSGPVATAARPVPSIRVSTSARTRLVTAVAIASRDAAPPP